MEYIPHLGEKDFNSTSFIEWANKFDLIIIGGGGFFSAFERFKNTGCHADFTLQTLTQIKTPIVYYAQGFSVYYGQKYHNTDKLESLFQYAKDNPKRVKISFRNDGSKERAAQFITSDVIDSIPIVPDGGFYVPEKNYEHEELSENQINIGIQLAGDKSIFRFQENNKIYMRAIKKFLSLFFNVEVSRNQNKILRNLADEIGRSVKAKSANLILLPHIHSDLAITEKFTHHLSKDLVRFSTNIAGVYRGHSGALRQFDLYRKLDLVIGMRFHANVCAFGVETPSIGLVSHDQLDALYQNLESDDYIYLSDPAFPKKLSRKIDELLTNPSRVLNARKQTLERLRATTKAFHNDIIEWSLVRTPDV